MGQKFHINRYKQILFFLVGVLIITISCTKEDTGLIPELTDPVKSGYIKMHLNTSKLHTPTTKTHGTRAMDNQAETAIDHKALKVLVFSYNDDGNSNITETFYYVAPISGPIVYDGNKATVIVRLMKSASPNDFHRIVVVANHDFPDLNMEMGVTTKEEILEQLTFSVPEKWNSDTHDYSPFPMYGEGIPIVISDNMPSPTINLNRALARIDVGLNFVIDKDKLTEQAYGIPGFKLTEILLFRTHDKGYVAPLSGGGIETPSVPSSALRHADNSPLDYFIPNIEGTDAFVREIYVPEADLPSNPDNDNTHCIVIGGFHQTSSITSYYRLDFATETDLGTRIYLPILRNHRYVFNITQVNGPGFASAISALESIPTVGNIDYDLIAWDAAIHEMETQGKYYFGIDNRNLLAEAQATSSDPNNKFMVKYQTNYPLSATDPIKLTWVSAINDPLSSPAFDAQWQPSGKNILVTAINSNLTNSLLSDTLYVNAGPFTQKIAVQQKYVDIKYSIDCSSIAVRGAYKRGITLNPLEHYITLSIIADNRGMQGQSYIIESTDPANYGISFRIEGIFDFTGIPEGTPLRIDNIRLSGNGTLQVPNNVNIFSLPIISDSPTSSSCTATIRLVIPRMNILVLSNINDFDGYAISRQQGGAGKLFNSPNNFGSNDNSIVKVEGFTFISTTNYNFAYSTTSDPYKWVTGKGNNGKLADIVYIAFPAFFETPTSRLLVEYLDMGGVIVAFIENASIQHLAGQLFNTSISYSENLNPAGSIYPFPAHPSNLLNENDLQNVLSKLEGDPILNGPFGDIRNKQWGEDASYTVNLRNVPNSPNLTIYSSSRNISPTPPVGNMDYVTAFKYETTNRNMVWFGDGGFMSSEDGIPTISNTLHPLYWDTSTFFPIPKPVYGSVANNRMPVYNSIAFCNIMAWAINKSESLRGKRGDNE